MFREILFLMNLLISNILSCDSNSQNSDSVILIVILLLASKLVQVISIFEPSLIEIFLPDFEI